LIKIKEGSQNPKKNYKRVQQMIMNLKVQVEESKRVEETFKNQLEEKKENEGELGSKNSLIKKGTLEEGHAPEKNQNIG
jgi:hypothetical protein